MSLDLNHKLLGRDFMIRALTLEYDVSISAVKDRSVLFHEDTIC